MPARRVTIDGRDYTVAFPLAGFRDAVSVEPRLDRLFDAVRGHGAIDYRVAEAVTTIGLRYGGGGVEPAVVYDRHGWPAFRRLAAETLLAGLPLDDDEAPAPEGREAGNPTAPAPGSSGAPTSAPAR